MYLKKFTNLKMGASVAAGAAGPQTFSAGTTWISAMVPVKGARQVLFILTATDTNGTQAISVNVGNAADGTGTLTSSSTGHTSVGSATGRMDKGGARYSAYANSGRFMFDFAQLSVQANAGNNHTAFQVDAEVWFDGDADVTRADAGQASVVPV